LHILVIIYQKRISDNSLGCWTWHARCLVVGHGWDRSIGVLAM
jgi:hypothetical protein